MNPSTWATNAATAAYYQLGGGPRIDSERIACIALALDTARLDGVRAGLEAGADIVKAAERAADMERRADTAGQWSDRAHRFVGISVAMADARKAIAALDPTTIARRTP